MYQKGWGVSQDYAQALSWYTKAAEQGNTGAQLNLGGLYEHGLGTSPDPSQARTWYQKAAEQGDPTAKIALARLDAARPVVKAEEAKPKAPKPTPPPTPSPAKSRVLAKQDVIDLLQDLEPKRGANLVASRGVSFALNPATEKELRSAGADDELLLAIATHKK
jgi:TPR repeat protein